MNTRYLKFIPVTAMLLSGIFPVRAQMQPTPGGATNTAFSAWLTPGSYDAGTWTNLISGGIGNFTGMQTAPAKINTNGYNFHPAVLFGKTTASAAPNQLYSQLPIGIKPSDDITAIFVFRQNVTNADAYLMSFSDNSAYNALWWNSVSNKNLSYNWSGSTRTVNNASEGILTVDNSNISATLAQEGIRVFQNGSKTAFASNQWNGTSNLGTGKVALGGGRNDREYYGYQGNLQEVILIKNPNNGHVNDADLRKIHSYLAIKYGITLNNADHYINSDGTAVWTRDAVYNTNIFGIGRDDASRLNQVQSRSAGNDLLTVFKGTLNVLNNNNSTALADKTCLMLGSSGQTGYVPYEYQAGEPFANGNLGEKVNYRTAAVYKAQVTSGGIAGGNQTVNMQVTYPLVRFVLVSANPAFLPGSTRIYPVTGQMATNIVINSGDYVSFSTYQLLPGNATNTGFAAWLTPDSYRSTGTWTNLIVKPGTVGDFSGAQTPPATGVSGGYNFHPVVTFNKTSNSSAPNQLFSQQQFPINTTDNVTSIFVFQRKTINNYDFLIGFSGSDNYNSLSWRNTGNNNLTFRWGGTPDRLILNAAEGILTVDNSNAVQTLAQEGIRVYQNGVKTPFASNQWNGTTNAGFRLVALGGAQNDETAYGYQGNLQEVILIKNPGNGHVDAVDLQKIHSYLAVKYGITLNNSDHYLNSDGNVVWTRDAVYNYCIFGIGRDNDSRLYQKQSQSVDNKRFTLFIGSKKETLNSLNDGILQDRQYLMLGANSPKSIMQLSGINNGDIYENGSIVSAPGFNVQSAVYKTQISGPETAMTVNLEASSNDFLYVLVSKDENFTPGVTRIYPVTNRLAQVKIDSEYKYIKYIGFSPGPGGVSIGLQLWLRADDDATLILESLPAQNSPDGEIVTDDRVAGFPASAYRYVDPKYDYYNLPAVSAWSDLIRGHNYTYLDGGTATGHRMPVMRYHSPELNYYPGVMFWANTQGNNASVSAYLANAVGVLPVSKPSPGHTTIFMMNSDFNNSPRLYGLMFGSATANVFDGPGYGIESNGSNGLSGRFRTAGAAVDGTQELFKIGATTILNYTQKNANGTTRDTMLFRFNGLEEGVTYASSAWNDASMNFPSQLGKGYTYDRTILGVMGDAIIYDKILTAEERQRVESYLAFKYGVTLYPSNTAYNRFSYTLSDNSVVWDGNQPGGKFVVHYNNVAAILRDDAARLYSRHAHSTNVGSLLHVGVAADSAVSVLSPEGNGLGNLHNMETVVFGNDAATGNTHIDDPEACGDFTDRFNRTWLIHKVTQNDRPITLLIGAQNNSAITIGTDAAVQSDYYPYLTPGYDVYLVVAASPDSLQSGVYRAVIPMTYINGEHQCAYTFSEEDTYVTFGWKLNSKGCPGDEGVVFTGSKTFTWSQWTTQINRSSNPGLTLSVNTPVDLGDSIQVTQTQVSYPAGVRAGIGYPRTINSPARGSLHLRRYGGNQDVVVTVKFNHPVIPEFSISALDYYQKTYEEVEIYGECAGSIYTPILSYADPKRATYRIAGNTATATQKRTTTSNTNKRAMVYVKFQGGVTTLTIKYRLRGNGTAGRHVTISPITFRPVPPPPPVNEAGLSFVKQVKERDITTCDAVEYSFHIQNTNCDPKKVSFSDILPEYMFWEDGSIGLDALSSDSLYNPSLNTNNYGNSRELKIDSLVIPGTQTLILTATALMDENAPSGDYGNQASVSYYQIVNNQLVQRSLSSLDRETLEPNTTFHAVWQQRQDTVRIDTLYSRKTYNANSEIEVIYRLTNPNADIADMYLTVDFNEEFTLVNGAVQVSMLVGDTPDPFPVLVFANPLASSFGLAGTANEDYGFTLPTGVMEIRFKLKAPDLNQIQDEIDEVTGLPTGEKLPLVVAHEFSSMMDDPCMQRALTGLEGEIVIPYSMITHIITNRHISASKKNLP